MCEHTTAFITPKGDPICHAISIRKFKGSETSYIIRTATVRLHLMLLPPQPALAANMQLLFLTIKEERRHIVSSGLISH